MLSSVIIISWGRVAALVGSEVQLSQAVISSPSGNFWRGSVCIPS